MGITTSSVFGQDAKQEVSKMDNFASKTGVIVRFEDHKLDDIKLSYGTAEAKIRVITSGGDTGYFYQLSNEGKYGTKTASIANEDLMEVIKAFDSLKSQAASESSNQSAYVENKFITDDGFQVGYFVSDGKVSWYMKLTKFGNGNTIFVKNIDDVQSAFNQASNKIDDLKSK
jgi:hypothetical protein